MTSKTCTPPTRPPTGLESSVLRPSRPTRSTSHDWIIQSHDLTQPATNDPGGLSILMGGSFFEEAPAASEVARPLKRYLGAATERRGLAVSPPLPLPPGRPSMTPGLYRCAAWWRRLLGSF